MEITLYQNRAERNRVDKMSYLSSMITLSGTLRDSASIVSMTIVVQSSTFPNYNYAYIAEFNRYYYIEDIISVRQNVWELTLSIDVLMTYKSGIQDLYGFIDRAQSLYNDRLIDKKRVIEQGYDIETTEITNSVFSNYAGDKLTDWRYIITGYKLSAVEKPTEV